MVVAVLPQSIKAIIQHSIKKSSFIFIYFSILFRLYLYAIIVPYARTVPTIYMQEPCQKIYMQEPCQKISENNY